jgi:hypothetical protein
MKTIIKRQREPHFDFDAFVWAMWITFCSTPQKPGSDENGFYDLAEIGTVPDKNWSKASPYSPAQVSPGPK